VSDAGPWPAGLLSVYVDDMAVPVLVVPLSLDTVVGRCRVTLSNPR
jgi:hypothetical protein